MSKQLSEHRILIFDVLIRLDTGRYLDAGGVNAAVNDVEEIIRAEIGEKMAEQRANYRADIAQAIGYCQGLGHPNDYLEKRYPEIVGLSTTLGREDKDVS